MLAVILAAFALVFPAFYTITQLLGRHKINYSVDRKCVIYIYLFGSIGPEKHVSYVFVPVRSSALILSIFCKIYFAEIRKSELFNVLSAASSPSTNVTELDLPVNEISNSTDNFSAPMLQSMSVLPYAPRAPGLQLRRFPTWLVRLNYFTVFV